MFVGTEINMKRIRVLLLTVMALVVGKAYAADTVYDGETISITWGMSEGEVNSKAVLSDRKTIMDYGWSCGSGFAISSTPTRVIHDKTVTVFYPTITTGTTTGTYDSNDYIEWTLTPYDALSFTPTKLKVDALKIGTDKPKMNVYVIDGAGVVCQLASDADMARIDNSHPYDAENNNEEKVFNITNCTSSPNAVKVRIYISNCDYTKIIGFANVTIEGTVTGISHFREEYAVNIASNNSDWGTVKSTKDYVVEDNSVTLTAIANRGYRFIGWADADNTIVSTDAVYTFVPEADINLIALFEPLAIYQVSVVESILGAGNIRVTNFEDGMYYEGDVIDIEALPNQGYAFVDWSDGVETWKRNTITLTADVDLTANFEMIGEPSVFVQWTLSTNTNAECTGNVQASFEDNTLMDTGNIVEIDGVTMRTFTPYYGDGSGSMTFHLDVSPAEGQVFVVRSIELDAARVGSSFGEFAISVGGSDIASDLYPGAFIEGVDYPHSHYYYNLGQTYEFSSGVDITLYATDVSSLEGKGIAFGNMKIQGYYKTKQVKVTIPYTGYTTYSSTFPLSFSGTGINSYIAKENSGSIIFTNLTNSPANTGLLLKGNTGTYWVPVVDEQGVVTGNLLQPMLVAGTVDPIDGEMQNLIFLHKTTGLGFFSIESAYNLAANSAYLQVGSELDLEFVSAPFQTIDLDEANTTVPTSFATGATVNVKRTITKDEWSTICLPFNMTYTQLKSAFGSDVKLAKFIGYDANEELTHISVIFDDVNLATDGFKANVPYIIKASKNVSSFTVDNVTLEPNEEAVVTEFDNGETDDSREVYGTFKGTYHAQTVIPENCLFISGNKFWYSKGLTKMKAFRAYFDFIEVLASVEGADSRIAMAFGQSTGISSNNCKAISDNCYYDLQGRRVAQPRKGLYIRNGKKEIVK